MSKRHGRLVFEWQDLRGFEDEHEPGVYDLYRKDTNKLHSRANHEAQLFWCKACKCEHAIPWGVISLVKLVLETHHIPALHQLCIDGDPFNFWQPGAPSFEGNRIRLLVLWELV